MIPGTMIQAGLTQKSIKPIHERAFTSTKQKHSTMERIPNGFHLQQFVIEMYGFITIKPPIQNHPIAHKNAVGRKYARGDNKHNNKIQPSLLLQANLRI